MKYSDTRSEIKSGDLILLSHQAWDSWGSIQSQVVKSVTQSEFSHVCVAWVIASRVFAIEAVVPKVRIMPVSNMFENGGIYWIPMPDKPMTEAELEFGLKHVGDSYSKLEAIMAQLELLKIGISEAWECAELTICMRKLSGLDLGPKGTPAAVAKKALELGYTLKYLEKD